MIVEKGDGRCILGGKLTTTILIRAIQVGLVVKLLIANMVALIKIRNTAHEYQIGEWKMNKNDREEIRKLISELEDITSRIETLRDAEQEKFDNMTERLQQTECGKAMEATVSSFDDAISDCENVRSNLESSME